MQDERKTACDLLRRNTEIMFPFCCCCFADSRQCDEIVLCNCFVNIYLFIEVQDTVVFAVRDIIRHYDFVSISMFAVKLKCGVFSVHQAFNLYLYISK